VALPFEPLPASPVPPVLAPALVQLSENVVPPPPFAAPRPPILVLATRATAPQFPAIDAIPEFKAQYKPRTRWLKRDEYAKLLDALEMVELPAGKNKREQKLAKPSPRLGLRVVNRRLWVAIAVGLGARRSEVEALDWAGIDLDAGVLANHGTKPGAATARRRSQASCSRSCARSRRSGGSGASWARGRASAATSPGVRDRGQRPRWEPAVCSGLHDQFHR
jgi:integrase